MRGQERPRSRRERKGPGVDFVFCSHLNSAVAFCSCHKTQRSSHSPTRVPRVQLQAPTLFLPISAHFRSTWRLQSTAITGPISKIPRSSSLCFRIAVAPVRPQLTKEVTMVGHRIISQAGNGGRYGEMREEEKVRLVSSFCLGWPTSPRQALVGGRKRMTLVLEFLVEHLDGSVPKQILDI